MKFIFIDTFAIAKLSKEKELKESSINYILSNSLTLVINTYLLIEIYKHKTAWDDILDFIASVPFVIAPNIEIMHDAEVKNYPNEITLPFSIHSSQISFNKDIIINAFKINMVTKISEFESKNKPLVEDILNSIHEERLNVLPDDCGKYSTFQFWLFLESNLLFMLKQRYPEFIKEHLTNKHHINENVFKSFNIGTIAIFYEYYVQKKIGKLSDLGDFWHLSYLPYCHYAVVDNERFNLIDRIKNDKKIISVAQKHNFSIPLNCTIFNYGGFLQEIEYRP